jgi:para-aminobenzoate N-oxygenase AurF
MEDMAVLAAVTSTLASDYRPGDPRLRALYERGLAAQWSVETDLDWTIEVPFGSPLPDGSRIARTSFDASPLGPRGRGGWDIYRWEVQSWMVSQFLHGEQGALVVAGRLVESLPGIDAKLCAAGQVGDEARHVDAFSRYLREHVPDPYPVNGPLQELMVDILGDSRWDVTALGMQIVVEALAMAAFRLAGQTFHDPLIRDITRLVGRDEARHVSFGVMSLREVVAELTAAERADREELVIEAASLMRRRFLLEDVWERLEVPRAEGAAFSLHDDLMVMYRQTVFSKVITALVRIGLMTERVQDALERLDLLEFAGTPRNLTVRN